MFSVLAFAAAIAIYAPAQAGWMNSISSAWNSISSNSSRFSLGSRRKTSVVIGLAGAAVALSLAYKYIAAQSFIDFPEIPVLLGDNSVKSASDNSDVSDDSLDEGGEVFVEDRAASVAPANELTPRRRKIARLKVLLAHAESAPPVISCGDDCDDPECICQKDDITSHLEARNSPFYDELNEINRMESRK